MKSNTIKKLGGTFAHNPLDLGGGPDIATLLSSDLDKSVDGFRAKLSANFYMNNFRFEKQSAPTNFRGVRVVVLGKYRCSEREDGRPKIRVVFYSLVADAVFLVSEDAFQQKGSALEEAVLLGSLREFLTILVKKKNTAWKPGAPLKKYQTITLPGSHPREDKCLLVVAKNGERCAHFREKGVALSSFSDGEWSTEFIALSSQHWAPDQASFSADNGALLISYLRAAFVLRVTSKGWRLHRLDFPDTNSLSAATFAGDIVFVWTHNLYRFEWHDNDYREVANFTPEALGFELQPTTYTRKMHAHENELLIQVDHDVFLTDCTNLNLQKILHVGLETLLDFDGSVVLMGDSGNDERAFNDGSVSLYRRLGTGSFSAPVKVRAKKRKVRGYFGLLGNLCLPFIMVGSSHLPGSGKKQKVLNTIFCSRKLEMSVVEQSRNVGV